MAKTTVPEHAHPMVRRFYAEILKQDLTLNRVCARAGINRYTVENWRNRSAPRIDTLEAALNAVGCQLIIVTDKEAADVRSFINSRIYNNRSRFCLGHTTPDI